LKPVPTFSNPPGSRSAFNNITNTYQLLSKTAPFPSSLIHPREIITSQDLNELYNGGGSPTTMLQFSAKTKKQECEKSTPNKKEDERPYGNENEVPVDNAALFLKTPGTKGKSPLLEGFLGNSANKFQVSPFFH